VIVMTTAYSAPALAQKGPSWQVSGAPVSSKLAPQLQVSGGSLSFLSKAGGASVEVSCTGAELLNVKLEIEGFFGKRGEIRFSGCQIKVGGSVKAGCEPLFGLEKGVFRTSELMGDLVSSEGTRRFRFRPLTGETFATISPIKKTECSLGESIPLLGSLTLKDEALKTEAATHTFSQDSLTALWLISKTEEHKTTADGSLQLSLTGEHKGLGWTYKEVVASWKVNGTAVSASLLPSLSVTELEGKSETILSTVAGVKFEKLCTGVEVIGAKLEPEGKISSGAKVKFTGCIIKLNGTVSPACEPHTGAEKGVIVTNQAKGLLVQDGSEGILLIEPVTGEVLVTVETGEECAIGEKIPLIGKLILTVSSASVESTTHSLTGSLLSELWLISKTEEHKVTVDGSAVLALSGAHSGLKWSGTVT